MNVICDFLNELQTKNNHPYFPEPQIISTKTKLPPLLNRQLLKMICTAEELHEQLRRVSYAQLNLQVASVTSLSMQWEGEECGGRGGGSSVVDDPIDSVEGEKATWIEYTEAAVQPERGHLTPAAGVVVGEVWLLRRRKRKKR